MKSATLSSPAVAPASGSAPAPAAAPTPLQRLRQMLRPDRSDVIAVTAFAVAIGVMLLATPVAVQAIVNFVAFGGAIPPLLVVALLLFLGLMFAGVLTALQTWTVEMLQRRLFVRTVGDIVGRLPRVRHDVWDDREGHEVINRFFDVVTIQKVGSFLLLDGLAILLSVLVGLVVLAFYHPLLFAFDVILLVIIAALVLGPLRRGTRSAILESKAKYALAQWLQQVARHPATFKMGGAEGWAVNRADELASTWVERRTAHYRTVFRQVLGVLGLQAVASVALLGLGGFLVIQGTLTLGQLVAAELIVTLVVSSVAKLGKHIEAYYDLMASVDKVGEMLDLPLEESGPRDELTGSGGSSVVLRDVSWRTPSGRDVLQDLSLELKPGERLGVNGSTGSGKSVLLDILWGLERPTGGAVRLDGVDLRELSTETLRTNASLVESSVTIIPGSVRENVRLGRQHVSDDDINSALTRVGLAARIDLLPQGLDTVLGPRARPLTGGEVRKLLMARAIAGSPRLLLVQDLLDHVDDDVREVFLDLLTDPAAEWTLVVVSHRSDVLARCDRLLDLDKPGHAVSNAGDPS